MEKPMEDAQANVSHPRRHFLSIIWGGLGLAALAELIWVAASFLRPGRTVLQDAASEGFMAAGAVEAFQPGTVTAFPRGRFYLARLADGGFLALSRRCPHLGRTLPWVEKEKQFLCPCHSSAFDMRGDVVRLPAPKGMDLYPVAIENAVVKVDTGRTLRRDRLGALPIVYPTSR